MKTKIFVYGTLKRNFAAENLMKQVGATFVREARTTPNYRLLCVGWFPGMVNVEDQEGDRPGVLGEVYEIDPSRFGPLDSYEGTPTLFRREEIELADGEKVNTYLFNGVPDQYDEVQTGIWVKGREW